MRTKKREKALQTRRQRIALNYNPVKTIVTLAIKRLPNGKMEYTATPSRPKTISFWQSYVAMDSFINLLQQLKTDYLKADLKATQHKLHRHKTKAAV